MKKIGEIVYVCREKEFRTEVFILPKIKKFIEEEKVSLAVLIPDAYHFYEQILFDYLYDNEKSEYDDSVTNFKIVYNKITESQGWNSESGLETSSIQEESSLEKDNFFYCGSPLSSVKDVKREFSANYFVLKVN